MQCDTSITGADAIKVISQPIVVAGSGRNRPNTIRWEMADSVTQRSAVKVYLRTAVLFKRQPDDNGITFYLYLPTNMDTPSPLTTIFQDALANQRRGFPPPLTENLDLVFLNLPFAREGSSSEEARYGISLLSAFV